MKLVSAEEAARIATPGVGHNERLRRWALTVEALWPFALAKAKERCWNLNEPDNPLCQCEPCRARRLEAEAAEEAQKP